MLQMQMIGLFQVNIDTPNGAASIASTGDLKLVQSTPTHLASVVRTINNVNPFDSYGTYSLQDILEQYYFRSERTVYDQQSLLVKPLGYADKVSIDITVKVPFNQKIRYVPGILETLKYAWIQYLAIFLPALQLYTSSESSLDSCLNTECLRPTLWLTLVTKRLSDGTLKSHMSVYNIIQMFKKVVKAATSKSRTRDDDNDDLHLLPVILTDDVVVGTKRPREENENQPKQPYLPSFMRLKNGVGQQISVQDDQENNEESDHYSHSRVTKRMKHTGISVKELDSTKMEEPQKGGLQKAYVTEGNTKGVGLISAGGKQPQFQFISSLGKFEIKDKKLEEYLKTQLPNHSVQAKSDFEIESELRAAQNQLTRECLLEQQRDLYRIPAHLDVDSVKNDRRLIDHTNWLTGLIEVQVNQERKIGNVEAAEKLRLQMLRKELDVEETPAPKQHNFLEPQQNSGQRKHGGVFGKGLGSKDDLMKMVEREMMVRKPSRQKMRDQEEKRESNRMQEEHLQKQYK